MKTLDNELTPLPRIHRVIKNHPSATSSIKEDKIRVRLDIQLDIFAKICLLKFVRVSSAYDKFHLSQSRKKLEQVVVTLKS